MSFKRGWRAFIRKNRCPRARSIKLMRIRSPPKGEFRVKCDNRVIGTLYTGVEVTGIAVMFDK